MLSEDGIRSGRPITLAAAGFTGCSHPIRECYSVPHASHAPWGPRVGINPSALMHKTASHCLTCGYSLSSADQARNVVNPHWFVNYKSIVRYARMDMFDFFIKQRRSLGPVFGG